MIVRFSVCPHDTEKGLSKWIDFSKKLSEKLGIEVDFEPIKSFEEESEKLKEKKFHLYYSGPLRQIELLNNGYLPVAKFKGQKDVLFTITKKGVPEKGTIRIALPFLKPAGYSLINFDINRTELVFTKNFYEVYKLVKEEKVDVGIMYNETWDQIKDKDKDDIKILDEHKFESHHIFMVEKSLYERLKPVLLSFEELEEATENDIKKIANILRNFEMLSHRWEMENIANFFINSDFIAILIHRENKIIFINDYMSKLTSFDKDEILNMSFTEFKNRIKNGIENSFDVPFITKDNRRIYLDIKSYKVIFLGKPAEIVIMIDNTKRKRFETLINLLKEVNKAIIYSNLEEELFEKILNALVEKVGLKLVWIGEQENDYIKPAYVKGDTSDYTKDLFIPLNSSIPEGRGPTARAYTEGKIFINQDTEKNEFIKPWKEKMLKFNLLSSASIPLRIEGKPKYTLNLYSDERNFFDEQFVGILEELRKDLEYGLEKINQIRKSFMISEALKNSKSWVLITDENGTITYINEFVEELTGYKKEEVIGKNPRIFKSGYQGKYFYENLWNTILSGKYFDGIFINRKKNGEIFYLQQRIYPVILPGNVKRFISVGIDITKESMMASEINKLKFYDSITGLYNLYGFSFKAQETLKDKNNIIACLILFDINNFTLINKTYGFKFGDAILAEVANRLKSIFRENDIIGRISSDEFGILVNNIRKNEDIATIILKFREIFKEDFEIENIYLPISINAGIAIFPDDDTDFGKLYEKASLALKEAKSIGQSEIRFYNKEMEEKALSFTFAESLINRALKENLFVFYYQPYFKIDDLTLIGFEALIRIRDTDGKVYTPATFISVLENSRFLRDFEIWGLEKVKEKSKKWKKPISLNISGNSFKEDEFLEILKKIESGYEITYEITERVLINQFEKVKTFISDIKSRGNIKVAIDDFGTGYSSLNYLKDMDADILKIDMSFIRNMTNSKKDFAVVKTIVDLSKNLGMESLAEGVETLQQYEMLKSIGCNYVQGYLFGKPMPEEEVEKVFGL